MALTISLKQSTTDALRRERDRLAGDLLLLQDQLAALDLVLEQNGAAVKRPVTPPAARRSKASNGKHNRKRKIARRGHLEGCILKAMDRLGECTSGQIISHIRANNPGGLPNLKQRKFNRRVWATMVHLRNKRLVSRIGKNGVWTIYKVQK